jgi:hypothetical protein
MDVVRDANYIPAQVYGCSLKEVYVLLKQVYRYMQLASSASGLCEEKECAF